MFVVNDEVEDLRLTDDTSLAQVLPHLPLSRFHRLRRIYGRQLAPKTTTSETTTVILILSRPDPLFLSVFI